MSITSSTDVDRACRDIERFRKDRRLLHLLCGLSALAGVVLWNSSRVAALGCGVIWLCASVALYVEARRALAASRAIDAELNRQPLSSTGRHAARRLS